MIEVLVAIVIFAFGMLGQSALQSLALKYQQSSWARATVSGIAYDISERVRANIVAAKNGNYNYTANYATAHTLSAPAACAGNATNQIAACDLAEWAYSATRQLPGGAANISGSVATGFTVTVMWADKSFLDLTGSPAISATCPATLPVTASGLKAMRTCCPASAGLSATAGVRCENMNFLP